MRVISFIIVALFLLLTASPVSSQTPAKEVSPIRVAVAPLVYTDRIDPLSVKAVREAVVRGSSRYLATAGFPFELVSGSTILRRLRDDATYDDGVAIGAEWSRLGIEKYRQLDPEGAGRDLRHAYQSFLRVGHDFVRPAEVAEVLRFLALALLERGGEVAGPLDAMKAMIMLLPSEEMKRGAYPDEVVQFFESARLTLERELRDRGPDPTMLARFADVADVDYVIASSVLPETGSGVEVVSWLWDAEAQQLRARESLELKRPIDEQALEAAANRLASRLVASLVPAEEATAPADVQESGGDGPFSLQLNLAYASFLRFPAVGEAPSPQEVTPFGNVGAAIGGTFAITREFAVVGIFQFLNSTAEHSGLVVPGFTTLRWFLGIELGVDTGPVRFSLAPSLEGAAISTIGTCPADAMKRADGRCAAEVVELPARFLIGVNARPRISVRVLDALDVYGAASGSFFFAPRERTEVNLLTTTEAGLQYRF